MGNGTARSYVTTNLSGAPVSIGMEFTEGALNNLPQPAASGRIGTRHATGEPHVEEPEDFAYELAMPAGAPRTLVDHVSFDWNPHGHPAPGIYTVPHFDVHFYMMTRAQRQTITPGSNGAAPAPAARYIPTDFFTPPPGETVPFMGVHWIDSKAPELNPPKLFDKTFIYGFNKGNMVFFEPMVTRQYLLTKPDFSAPVKQPAAYKRAGYYPTRYSVKYNETTKTYSVSLDDMVLRQGSSTD